MYYNTCVKVFKDSFLLYCRIKLDRILYLLSFIEHYQIRGKLIVRQD